MAYPDLSQPHTRALVALLRFVRGPLLFEPTGAAAEPLCRVVVPNMNLFILAVGKPPSLTLEEVGFSAARTKRNAIIIRPIEDDHGWTVVFDIVICRKRVATARTHYALFRGHDPQPFFVPTVEPGPAIHLGATGLATCRKPYADAVQRMEGLGRGAAELMMVVDGPACIGTTVRQD